MDSSEHNLNLQYFHGQLIDSHLSDNFLQNIFDVLQSGISILNENYTIAKTNKWVENKYGKGKSLKGSLCFNAFCNRDTVCEGCPASKVFKTKEMSQEVLAFPSIENAQGWLEVTAFPIKDEGGKVIQVLEIFRDITEKRILELKLKEKTIELEIINKKLRERNKALQITEDELRSNIEELYTANIQIEEGKQIYEGLYKYAPLAYQSLDFNGNILEVNPAWLKILGYKKEEVIGKWFGDFLPRTFVPGYKKRFETFKERGFINNEHLKLRKSNGRYIDVLFEGNIGYTPEGKFKQTFCTFKDVTKEKQAELFLRESEEKYKVLVNAAPYGIVLCDKTGRVLFNNPAFNQIFGYTENEILKKKVWEFPVENTDEKKIKEGYEKIIKNRSKPETYFFKSNRVNGDIIYLKIDWDYVNKKNGNLEGIICIVGDITETRLQQNKIREALDEAHIRQEEIAALLKASQVIPVARNFDSAARKIFSICKKLIGATSGYVALLSENKKENEVLFLDSGGATCNVNPDLPMPIRGLREIAYKIKDVAFENDFANSEWNSFMPHGHVKLKNVLFAPLIIEGEPVGLLGLANKKGGFLERDVKMTKAFAELAAVALTYVQHHDKLIKSENRFKKLFENMRSGVAIYEPIEGGRDFKFVGVNKKAEKITNTAASDLIGKTLLEEFPNMENTPLYKALKEVNTTKKDKYLEPFFYKDAKREGWRENNLYILPSGEIVAIFTDVTERIISEQLLLKQNVELIKAKEKAEESDRLKTEFLNNMSHEIRTPMNGIIGFSEILDQEGLDIDKRRFYTSIIRTSSQQLLRIIDDILEISTLETKQVRPNIEKVYFNSLLMELFSIYNIKAKEHKIHLYLRKGLSDDESCIETDKTKLSKIINNLVENALKFTFDGYIEIGYHLKGDSIELYVKDTGVGISSENFDVIFKRFSQEDKTLSRKAGGLGLGLSIAKENAELLGGSIRLESVKGKGTTFYVLIPYKPISSKDRIKTEFVIKRQEEKNKTLKILVAEDEEINYLYIEEVLRNSDKQNFKIVHAKNGKEAVDICIDDKEIDLVLMDIKLPVMTGYEATAKIKEARPDLPVIAQTAYAGIKDREEALSHGCNEFISKPIDKKKLVDLIVRMTDG